MSAIYVFVFYCSEITYFNLENRNMKCDLSISIADVVSMNIMCTVPTVQESCACVPLLLM